ncbi:hypothetical protein BH23ACT11_BH23ACT11_13060 [soil metagenome]
MSFEIRSAEQSSESEPEAHLVCHFADNEWWNLLSLTHECGFDNNQEFVSAVYPASEEKVRELDEKSARGLYFGVSAILNQDTLPFATTWDTDDDRLHFRWAREPVYAPDRKPHDNQNPGARSDFDLDKAELHRLLNVLSKGPVLVARLEDAGTY